MEGDEKQQTKACWGMLHGERPPSLFLVGGTPKHPLFGVECQKQRGGAVTLFFLWDSWVGKNGANRGTEELTTTHLKHQLHTLTQHISTTPCCKPQILPPSTCSSPSLPALYTISSLCAPPHPDVKHPSHLCWQNVAKCVWIIQPQLVMMRLGQ
eukprot:TRINITY_DN65749_c0_g1_i3.p1 TRINITY_DN65749_c0_g1~~TRINITY_DN65749_c0_g1_i3.p1  ORF type:complete len:154 (-),score=2.62 TRINITY_DN65749_c0_g1_i3:89-550(-)